MYQILWTFQAKSDTHLTAYDSHFYCFQTKELPTLVHETSYCLKEKAQLIRSKAAEGCNPNRINDYVNNSRLASSIYSKMQCIIHISASWVWPCYIWYCFQPIYDAQPFYFMLMQMASAFQHSHTHAKDPEFLPLP